MGMLTRADIRNISSVIDQKLDVKFEPIKKTMRELAKDQRLILKSIDMMLYKHHRRLDRLENHAGLPPLAD